MEFQHTETFNGERGTRRFMILFDIHVCSENLLQYLDKLNNLIQTNLLEYFLTHSELFLLL